MNNIVKKVAATSAVMVAGLSNAAVALAGVDGGVGATTGGAAGRPGAITSPQGYSTDIGVFIGWVLTVVMVIAILLVLLYLVLGGIEWITSGGEKSKTEAARNKITAAVIGIIILASAYALASFVAYIMNFDLANIFSAVKPINQR
ncbi:hypothetical protein KA078_03710 [Candidatus Woesebacteria bacterium]|nr:hypothetical protein [Candidatus Woesebacteria bacterium]